MKNQLQTFDFNQSPVRVIDQGGQPWFVAKDVCEVLEIANHHQAINGRAGRNNEQGLDEDERGVASVTTPSGIQEMLVINESGLYTLIFKSRKAVAKAFRKWVTSEVLPTIRKTGGYSGGVEDRVQGVLEQMIVDVYEGRLSIQKAEAIAGLVRNYSNGRQLRSRNQQMMPTREESDFETLVAALWEIDKENQGDSFSSMWTPREIAQVAYEEGLFDGSLHRDVAGSVLWANEDAAARFGELCDRFNRYVFGGVRFEVRGKGRARHFVLRREK